MKENDKQTKEVQLHLPYEKKKKVNQNDLYLISS
jgi:hypothetical protein